MKIVIDIPDRYWEVIERQEGLDGYTREFVINQIYHGTPLPKNHGRLIDADVLKEDFNDCQYSKEFCAEHYIDYSIHMGIVRALTDDAPTIIEAEREDICG